MLPAAAAEGPAASACRTQSSTAKSSAAAGLSALASSLAPFSDTGGGACACTAQQLSQYTSSTAVKACATAANWGALDYVNAWQNGGKPSKESTEARPGRPAAASCSASAAWPPHTAPPCLPEARQPQFLGCCLPLQAQPCRPPKPRPGSIPNCNQFRCTSLTLSQQPLMTVASTSHC